jgi:ribose 5-phosphate isomerase B
MAMTANRFAHIRAALCSNATVARFSREHNDANVLVLGANVIGVDVALDCLKVFIETPALGGRYAERCKALGDLGGL